VRLLRGVITDWGGVMTNPVADTVNAWLTAESIDKASYRAIMRRWVAEAYAAGSAENPIHALERGESPDAEFEVALASQLVREDGQAVTSAGLLARMFGGTVLDPAMIDLFRGLHSSGVPTALLSNSWGDGGYPREKFPEMFDAVVISGDVGMRKPEPRIFLHVAGLLGLPPAECVFIDDVEANVLAAEQVGFTGVLHSEAQATIRRLSELLGLDLEAQA
jgi:epoxide hydrolase-like predicted phosphatase